MTDLLSFSPPVPLASSPPLLPSSSHQQAPLCGRAPPLPVPDELPAAAAAAGAAAGTQPPREPRQPRLALLPAQAER